MVLDLVADNSIDSDYEDFVETVTKKEAKPKKKHVLQNWKVLTTLKETYLEKYTDSLIRDQKWVFKIEYNKGNNYVLKCDEGQKCPYKKRIEVKEVVQNLPPEHYLSEICKSVFENKIYELKIEENDQIHQNHHDNEKIKDMFKERSRGMSEFSKLLVQNLNLHLKKHVDRIQDLKALLKENYLWHVPSTNSLSNYCHYVRRVQFLKDFSGSIGDFKDLKEKYSFGKIKDESDLVILDIQENVEDFVLVFSCNHFLKHIIQQSQTTQPSFFCSDTTFSLIQNHYKLIVIGTNY